MKQRRQYKNNFISRRATIGISMLFVACLLIFGKSYASAAPATLISPSSVVYEAADENSNAVGSLMQGNTFELNDTITAENGETWHLVSMSNGIQGYMKGEVSTDIGNTPPDAEPQAEEGEDDEEGDAVEEDTSAEDGEENTAATDIKPISSNTRKKTYSIKADADRIRAQIQPDEETQDLEGQNTGRNVDKTLLVLLCVALFSAVLIVYSYKKLMQIFWGRHIEFLGKTWTENHKARKRKKAKKAKKKRAAKEAKKWKNNSLQK